MPESVDQEQMQECLQRLLAALEAGDLNRVNTLISSAHPAEIANLLEALPHDERLYTWEQVEPDRMGETLAHLSDFVRDQLVSTMAPSELIAATESLDPDDLADLLPDLPEDVINTLLATMDAQDRQRLEAVLSYPEDSAGGLMNVDPVTIRADITLDVVLRYLRRRGELPETTDALMVVNRKGRYLGVLPLATLLTHDPAKSVAEVMNRRVEPILTTLPAREVAAKFAHHDLVTAPVVDEAGILLGRITIDDVVDVIRVEAEHTIMGMSGLTEEEDIFAPVLQSSRRRAVWLGVNLLTAFLASWVIGLFELTIERLVALAVLMPVVASMGGIAGSQTLTLVIRGMALNQIGSGNTRQLLHKELAVGAINGLAWAVVIALVAAFWFSSLALGGVIGSAIIVNLVVAALSGATIPLLLRRFGADPALAGGVVLTTVTDVVGFFTFLGLATLFLI